MTYQSKKLRPRRPKALNLALSANAKGVSRVVTGAMRAHLTACGMDVETWTLDDLPAAWVQPGGVAAMPAPWRSLFAAAEWADCLIMTGPVYAYSIGSPFKAVTEVLGPAIAWKPALLLVAAGSMRSHLAAGPLAASLAYEQSTICMPETVLVTAADVVDQGLTDEMDQRLARVAARFHLFATALEGFATAAAAVESRHAPSVEQS